MTITLKLKIDKQMKKYILILALILTTINSYAQFSVSYSAGYGSYKMDDLKNLLDQRLSEIDSRIDAQITDKFPGYITHTIDASYGIKDHEFGLKLTYLTTGGKIAYSDYSGEYMEKLTLNGYRIGALYRNHFAKVQLSKACNISFFGELSPGIIFSKLDYESYIKLGDDKENIPDNISCNMTGFTILPQIGAKFNIPYNIGFLLTGGYDFEFGSKIKNDTDIRADWSGIRINAGVSYNF